MDHLVGLLKLDGPVQDGMWVVSVCVCVACCEGSYSHTYRDCDIIHVEGLFPNYCLVLWLLLPCSAGSESILSRSLFYSVSAT